MSKTLLLNNTSKYHNGCAKVIETFAFDHSIETNEDTNVNFAEYDKVILNGEGTMHHTRADIRQNPIKFLKALRNAQFAGCETQLVNTVWQEKELKEQHNIDSVVKPDRSIIPDVEYVEYEHNKVYQGQWFYNGRDLSPSVPKIDIFKQDWNEIVNRLRHCDLLVTGRHHEAYAAIKAKCKFIVLPGNTHKNEGIYLTAEIQPFTSTKYINDIIEGKYNKEFEKLSEYYIGNSS